jgi:hypothetical protein
VCWSTPSSDLPKTASQLPVLQFPACEIRRQTRNKPARPRETGTDTVPTPTPCQHCARGADKGAQTRPGPTPPPAKNTRVPDDVKTMRQTWPESEDRGRVGVGSSSEGGLSPRTPSLPLPRTTPRTSTEQCRNEIPRNKNKSRISSQQQPSLLQQQKQPPVAAGDRRPGSGPLQAARQASAEARRRRQCASSSPSATSMKDLHTSMAPVRAGVPQPLEIQKLLTGHGDTATERLLAWTRQGSWRSPQLGISPKSPARNVRSAYCTCGLKCRGFTVQLKLAGARPFQT